jgi:AcrR family transcriptional regulator
LIAETALELFSEHGFADTTVEQIAAAAEVGPRTVWRYFPTKETLIVEFVERHLSAALDRLKTHPENTPPAQALYAVVDSVIGSITANSPSIMTAYELAARTPSVRAQFNELWWTWRGEVSVEISRRRKRGKSPDLASDMSATLCMVAIDTSVRAWVEGGGRDTMRRLVNRVLDMMRNGEVPIATPPARSS